jgi:outer membrane autotransporter protein
MAIIWMAVFHLASLVTGTLTFSAARYSRRPETRISRQRMMIAAQSVDRFGVFYTHAESSGDISGNVLGGLQLDAGRLDLTEDSIAGYWTHLSPNGWYVDVVAKYAWLNGSSESNRGIGADLDGHSLAASVETGVPFVIADGWTIEPQAQLIWQRIDFDDTSDPFSEISHDSFDSLTGRLGARLEYSTGALLAHLSANLWHGFSEDPSAVTFNTVPILIESEGTWLEVNGGAAFTISEKLTAFGDVSYSSTSTAATTTLSVARSDSS